MSESEHLTTPARRRLITWRGLAIWLVAPLVVAVAFVYMVFGVVGGDNSLPIRILATVFPLSGLLFVIGIIVQVARRKTGWRGLAELALWLVALLLCVGTLLFLVVGVLFDDSGLPTLPIVAKILALPAVLLFLIGICIRKSRRLATQRPRLAFWLVAAPTLLIIGGAGIFWYVLYAS